MKSQIISIGDELLLGDVLNTNAGWLGQFLTQHGAEVARIHTIGDNLQLIKETIRQSLSQSDLVITTGGLGPTHDDVTKSAVQELFGAGLVIHQPTLDFIQKMFKKRDIPFSKSNYHQAEVPDNCEVLFNGQGTAPGLWFEEYGSRLAVLPGIPFEMKQLMEHQVLPKIEAVTKRNKQYYSKYIITAGIGESTLSDEMIGDLENFLSKYISVAYLPGLQGVQIRISGQGTSRKQILERMAPVTDFIYEKAGDVIIGEGKEFSLSEATGNVLRRKHLTIAAAESCTGGLLSDMLTGTAGSSDYMLGGIVAYANRIKTELLGVSEEDLALHGAVSKTVALQMAKGIAAQLGSDIGISTTGIAGPGGGTPGKPVGTVWIGYWSRDRHFVLKTLFANDRIINKKRSAVVALEMVRRSVLGIETMPYALKPHMA